MRKTISIKWLIEHVNEFNRTSEDIYVAEREGKSQFLETILHEAGCYNGFSYLSACQLEKDAMSVGIRELKANGLWNFDDTDHTRVEYFIDGKL